MITEDTSVQESSQKETWSEERGHRIIISRNRTPRNTTIQRIGKEREAILKEFQKTSLEMCEKFGDSNLEESSIKNINNAKCHFFFSRLPRGLKWFVSLPPCAII